MKRLLILMAAALVAALAAQPAAAATRNKCKTSSTTGGAKIVKKTSSVVVFKKKQGVYGCAYSGGPIAELLDEGGGITTTGPAKGRPQIAGRYVAYATTGSAIGDEFDRVVVWDLKAGKMKTEAASNVVLSMVLKPNGSVAWVQGSTVQEADPNQPVYEVHEISQPEFDGDVLLYRGRDVDAQSLTLIENDTKVAWNVGTANFAAPLP